MPKRILKALAAATLILAGCGDDHHAYGLRIDAVAYRADQPPETPAPKEPNK